VHWFRDLKLRWKLLGSFGFTLALMGIVGYLGISRMAQMSALSEELYTKHLLGLSYIMQANINLIASGRAEKNAILAEDRAEVEKHAASARTYLDEVNAELADFKTTVVLEETRQALAATEADLKELAAGRERVLALAFAGNDAEAVAEAAKVRVLADKIDQSMHDLQVRKERLAEAAHLQARRHYESARTFTLAVIAIAALAGFGLAYTLSRALGGTAARLSAAARGLAAGEVDQRIIDVSRDEMGELAASFRELVVYLRENAAVADAIAQGDLTREVRPRSEQDVLGMAFQRMSQNLRAMVGQTKEAADALAAVSQQLGQAATQTGAAVEQVTAAVQGIAAGASESSRSVQQTNSSVEQLAQAIDAIARGAAEQSRQVQAASGITSEMAASVAEVASTAAAVAQESGQTRATAEHGARAVRETVADMEQIKRVVSSAAATVEELGKLGERIGAVVEVIDDIAEQTNLLALNAAIEAARAGQHGRGFAVVADEVRKLAERSQRETKAIAQLIEQVQTGTAEAVAAMETGSAQVEAGTAQAGRTGMALAEILVAVESTVTQATGIAAAAREMAEGARGLQESMDLMAASVEANRAATEEMVAQAASVTQAMQAIAAVSEEQSASSEEVSASAEEMSAQMQQMGQQSQELARAADQLRQLVARFVLEHAADAAHMTPLQRAA
jgi:methyl-accepting chemotaxis protein